MRLLAVPESLSRSLSAFIPALEGDAGTIAVWALGIGGVAGLGLGAVLGAGLVSLVVGRSQARLRDRFESNIPQPPSLSERLLALDVVRFAPAPRNLRMLDELVELFRGRVPIPDDAELPRVHPRLDDYAFPTHVLDEKRLELALSPARVEAIRKALLGQSEGDEMSIEYHVPWHQVVREESVDLVYSQACLEHIDDLEGAYEAMYQWLVPGGAISHQIDFKSHNITPEWDGHRQYPDFAWSLVRGARSFLINREPLSVHMRLIEKWFEIRTLSVIRREPELPESRLAARFRLLSEDDRTASGLFVQAVKRRSLSTPPSPV